MPVASFACLQGQTPLHYATFDVMEDPAEVDARQKMAGEGDTSSDLEMSAEDDKVQKTAWGAMSSTAGVTIMWRRAAVRCKYAFAIRGLCHNLHCKRTCLIDVAQNCILVGMPILRPWCVCQSVGVPMLHYCQNPIHLKAGLTSNWQEAAVPSS